MKKDYIVLSFAAMAIVLGVVGFVISNATKEEAPKPQYAAQQPCELLTLAEAKEVLGSAATLVENGQPKNNGDLQIQTCSYGLGSGRDAKIASVTVRSALTDEGIKSNQRGFDQNMAGGAMVTVEGYGDHAYWDADKAQFDIHSGRDWIIVTNSTTDLATATLDDAKLVADKALVK